MGWKRRGEPRRERHGERHGVRPGVGGSPWGNHGGKFIRTGHSPHHPSGLFGRRRERSTGNENEGTIGYPLRGATQGHGPVHHCGRPSCPRRPRCAWPHPATPTPGRRRRSPLAGRITPRNGGSADAGDAGSWKWDHRGHLVGREARRPRGSSGSGTATPTTPRRRRSRRRRSRRVGKAEAPVRIREAGVAGAIDEAGTRRGKAAPPWRVPPGCWFPAWCRATHRSMPSASRHRVPREAEKRPSDPAEVERGGVERESVPHLPCPRGQPTRRSRR